MNILKALAKMTKLAVRLEHELGITRHDFAEDKNKRLLTEQVAAERYDRIKELEAKLYAAEQNAASRMHFEAVAKLNALAHAWSVPDGRWVDPLPKAPVALPPTLDADWGLNPWATHLLGSRGTLAFAELVNGEYEGPPESDAGFGRLLYHVGLKVNDFQVLATRPGYVGPNTRGLRPPEFVGTVRGEADEIPTNKTPWPKRPEGTGWRNNRTAAAPKDMSERIEAQLLNGTRTSKPASEFEWACDSIIGVAWWRFDRPDRDDPEPAK